MKKVSLFVGTKHRIGALQKLRELGVLHVRPVRPPESEDIDQLRTEAELLEKALSILPPSAGTLKTGHPAGAESAVSRILDIARRRESVVSQLTEKKSIRDWYGAWGDFSWSTVQALGRAGITIRLYLLDRAALKALPKDRLVAVVGRSGGSYRVAMIAESPEDRLDFKEEIIPPVEAAGLESDIYDLESEIASLESEMAGLSHERPSLEARRKLLKKKIEFSSVLSGMGAEDGIEYIQGFCPHDAVLGLENAAEREGWGTVIEDPDDPAEVPTLIRNPKWIRIIDPLIKFMGTVPGYGEKDISPWFLLFFTLFFAMLIGDAGYGLVFLALTRIAQKKAGEKAPQEFFRLLYLVSAATVAWGAATGTWFSIPQISRLPFFRNLVIPQLDGSVRDNSGFMMYLCFIIAVVQLTLAHVLNALKTLNSPRALAELGWIFILWPVFFLAGHLILDKSMPGFAAPMFIAGAALALLFSNFQKNVLKGMLTTLTSLPFSILGSFSDTVSYLRLYAVGIAGVTVSASFNSMLLGSMDNVAKGVLAGVFLLLAHALNIVLGCMSVLVHGVRLNLLEFSGHLGMSWTGRPYKPFRE